LEEQISVMREGWRISWSPNVSGTYFIADDDDDDDLCAPETFVVTLREEIILNVLEKMPKRILRLCTCITTENSGKHAIKRSSTFRAA
jgi:hypothetical protein